MSGQIECPCAQATAFSTVVSPMLGLEVAELLLEDAGPLLTHESALRTEPVVGEALLTSYVRHSSAPFFQT